MQCLAVSFPSGLQINLISQRHALQLVKQPAPIVRQHLGVFDTLASPVLIPPANVVLRSLESDEFVTNALLDKDGAVMLVDNGFFVL